MTPLVASWFFLIGTVTLFGSAQSNYSYKRSVTYAGPIVYSDEKPPVIQFPGPPLYNSYNKPSTNAYGGYGDSKSSITYVPLPLDDLPILIYQSKDKPPVHVLNRPGKDSYSSGYSGSSGNSGGGAGYYNNNYGGSNYANYGSSGNSYGSGGSGYATASGYGANTGSQGGYAGTYTSAPKPFYISKPAAPSTVYLPQVKPNSYSYGSGYSSNYGGGVNNYGSSSGSGYGGGSYSYNTAGSSGSSGYYSGQVKQQPPHIVYSGHPPIHVYQQPTPTYSQAQTPSYGSSYSSGYSKPQSYSNSYAAPPKQNNYVPAPPGYHKPPIIIYQGVRPPVHVYNEPSASTYGSSSVSTSSASGSSYSGTASGGYVGSYSSKNGEQWEPVAASVQDVDSTQSEVKVVTFTAGDKDEQEVVVVPDQALDLTTEAEQQKQETTV